MPDQHPAQVSGEPADSVDGPENGPAAAAREAGGPLRPPSRHTSVLYFHGMGDQRRHEELCRLVDSLDAWSGSFTGGEAAGEVGKLRGIGERFEVPRDGAGNDVCYIRADHLRQGEKGEPQGSVYRFYEVYWASVTAGGTAAGSVLRWLLGQIPAPLRTLRSPWRERQRLRRAALLRLWWCRRRTGDTQEIQEDFGKVHKEYHRFEGSDARRDFPKGSFRDFLAYLGSRAKDETIRKRQLAVAKAWRRYYVRRELTNMLVLASLGLGMVLLAAGLLVMVVFLWRALAHTQAAQALAQIGPPGVTQWLEPTWAKAVASLTLLGSLVGVTRFLGNYLGDVQFWTTYSETDTKFEKRGEILRRAAEMLHHVLLDPGCRRVVVVAHSLGTAIAMDALLQLTRHNRARNALDPFKGPLPLEKIGLFVTLGSPIDRIHYFFESRPGSYHRYNRVMEAIRGDLGSPPFARNRKQHVRWINFWDQGDPISSPLATPANGELPGLVIDNVHSGSLLFPDPGRSHSAYFGNREVLEKLYRAIFLTPSARGQAEAGTEYKRSSMGPGGPARGALFLQCLLLALPWLTALALLLHALPCGTVARSVILSALGLSVFCLVTAFIAGRIIGPLHPIPPRGSRDTGGKEL